MYDTTRSLLFGVGGGEAADVGVEVDMAYETMEPEKDLRVLDSVDGWIKDVVGTASDAAISWNLIRAGEWWVGGGEGGEAKTRMTE